MIDRRGRAALLRLPLVLAIAASAGLSGCQLHELHEEMVLATGSVSTGDDGGEGRLTFDEARGFGNARIWQGRLPNYRWSHDGSSIVVGRNGDWLDPRSGDEVDSQPAPPRPAVRPRSARVRKALEEEYDASEDQSRAWMRAFERAGDVGLVRARNRVHIFRDGKLHKIGKRGDIGAQLSPDGKRVALIRDHNIHVVQTADLSETTATTEGHAGLLHGRLDWVYQEEIYGRGRWDAMWWSPNSSAIAFLRLDQTGVPSFPLVDLRTFRVDAETMDYPKAGDPNPKVALGVWSASDSPASKKGVVWCDLAGYEGEILIVSVGWHPTLPVVIFQVQDREQSWLDLNMADPATGKVTRLLREESKSWVNVLGEPRWFKDGSFLWLSERSGYRHMYHYAPDGELIRAVTSGDWAVRSILRVDTNDDSATRIWFSANRESAVAPHAYRVDLDGSNFVHLTPGRGSHSVEINEEGTLLIDRYSSLDTPPRVRVVDADGNTVRELAAADPEGEIPLAKTTLYEVAARDGFPLDVAVTLPADFDPKRKYPIWLPTYSGPNAPSIRDRWRPDRWLNFLTQQGLVILQVNNRSSSGKGHFATAACYRQLGVSELEDIEDAVRWICEQPWADAKRIGIAGGSYGGFMAAYALTHSELFALGVSWAGVYDWRCYDTIYTERYMDKPQNNKDGYDRTSVVRAAGRLHGHLVLGHGSLDDNVHMQNVMQFAEALQKEGKQFDLMIYPGARHGIRNRPQRVHWNRMQWDAIQEHLLGRRIVDAIAPDRRESKQEAEAL